MIGIVLCAHANLAREMLAVLEQILGPQDAICPLSLSCEGHQDKDIFALKQAIQSVDRGRGIIILTDMFGGTPSNLAISQLQKGYVEIIAGFNLPMLIKLASIREEKDLYTVSKEAQEAGRAYIQMASSVLEPRNDREDTVSVSQAL